MGKWTIPLNFIFCPLACVTIKSEYFNFIVSISNFSKTFVFRNEISDPKSIITSNTRPIIITLHTIPESCVRNLYSSASFIFGVFILSQFCFGHE